MKLGVHELSKCLTNKSRGLRPELEKQQPERRDQSDVKTSKCSILEDDAFISTVGDSLFLRILH